jgi:solute:Na+ symporter, SSS family
VVTTALALGTTIGTLAVFSALGLWYSRGRITSIEDFITARNSTSGGMTTATLIASGMGAWILLSPAEAGAASGGLPAVIGYALGSAVPLLLFISVGTRVRALIPEGHSLTEYVLVRYGSRMYAYVLLVTMFYMFIFLASEMTGITLALELIAGVPTWQTAALIGTFVLVYTAYGGLVASIFTDTIQVLLILPLLAVGFAGAVVSLGGTDSIHRTVVSTHPQLLDPGYLPGLEFGVYIVFAVMGANLMNQGQWQRVYAASDTPTMRRAFAIAAITVVPMIFLAGLFGVAAAGLGLTEEGNASIAFFLVLNQAFPEWITLLIVLLAVLLVMSTADTMFNALASIVTADLPRLLDDPNERTLARSARALTIVVAIAAVWIGAQGYSVLTLFLTADLLAAATFIPFLYGLYSGGLTETGALVSSVLGLAVGVAFFPILQGVLLAVPGLPAILPAPSFLRSFLGAIVVSGGLTVVASRATSTHFDLDTLQWEICSLDDSAPDREPSAVTDGAGRNTAEERQ